MLIKAKKWIRFQKLRINWKILNKRNRTYPINYFDISKIIVGDYTYGPIEAYTYNCDNSSLIIGKFCSIAENTVFVLGGEHSFDVFSTFPYKEKLFGSDIDTISKGNIIVDDDVWIGHGATILSGVHIGQGAIVAAGAVVASNVPPYSIVGGVPAKVIKYRFSQEMIEELLKVDYSKLTKEMVAKHIDELYEKLNEKTQLGWLPKK